MAEEMSVHIQKAVKSHIPTIIELWKEFIDFHKGIDAFYTRSRDGHIKFGEYVEKQLEEEDSLVLVALLGEKVVAYAIARILKHPPVFDAEYYGDIVDLAVTATHRRKGIGGLMLHSIFDWFKSRDLCRVELRVIPGNNIGYSFWRKHGFKECAHTLVRTLGSDPRNHVLSGAEGSNLNFEGLTPENYHMTPDEFQEHGHAVVDWIADYYRGIESLPVLSRVEPGEVRASLPSAPPVKGEPFESILKDIDELIMPGLTHWQSPNFFAYFPANASFPAMLGELMSAGFGIQGMLWATSPACTELETHVLDWLAEMLALPAKFKSDSAGGGVIQNTASSATLCALLAARERATEFRSNRQGCDGRLVAYASTQVHSSMEKAVKIAGLGVENLRLIDVDETFALRPELLSDQLRKDRQVGLTPCFVCATIGTTSSNAIDPLGRIGEICRQEGIWLHVDAAMSGTAALCPEFRHIQEGLDLADSYCFNPHKWMFTNFDCDCFYVADRKVLIETLSVLPEYLRNEATESGAVIDYRDWHIPLGRRFRALKLWFVIRHYGVEGLQHHIREHVKLAQEFATWITKSEEFELAVTPPLNLVCFRHKAGDEITRRLHDSLNATGKLYLTHTVLDGRFTLRFCVGQTNTQKRHVANAWHLIQQTAASLKP